MTKLNWQGDDNRKIAYHLGIEYTIQSNDKGKFNVTERYLGQKQRHHENDLNSMTQAMRWAEESMLPLLIGEPVNKVYELIYDSYDCYYSIMHSLNKAVCEQFIQQVQGYDDSYTPLYDDFWAERGSYGDDALDKWEEHHPLRQWSEEIHGEYNQMGYYLAEDDFKSYAKNLRIREYTLDKAENK